MFECLVFIEDGEVFCVNDAIYPDTKIVREVRFIKETNTIEEAEAMIDQLISRFFEVYGHEGIEDYEDHFYRREMQVHNNDSWVLVSLLPRLRDQYGLSFGDPETLYTRHAYKRFYWILRNARQNYIPPVAYEYKDSAPETCPTMKGGEPDGYQTAD